MTMARTPPPPHPVPVILPRPGLRILWGIHKGLFRVSGGRIGTTRPSSGRVGTLFLHTIGHRTGAPRRTGLYYLEDGSNLVVVASNAGQDVDPAWYRNLQAQPSAEVELLGQRRRVRARTASPDEAARLWPRFEAVDADYAEYRRRVTRSIPVVILEPAPPESGPSPRPS